MGKYYLRSADQVQGRIGDVKANREACRNTYSGVIELVSGLWLNTKIIPDKVLGGLFA